MNLVLGFNVGEFAFKMERVCLIVSFSEIEEWDGKSYNKSENRVIDCSNSKERVLLEKLLLKDIQSGINKNKFEVLSPSKSSNSVHIKKPLLYQDNIILNNSQSIKNLIYTIRGQKVMIDSDLASLYGYSTKAFNQQVKNNIEKFDEDFRFQLTKNE